MNTAFAIVLIVVGLVLLIMGLGSTDSIQNAFSRLFTGNFTDRTMLLIIGGCVLLVVGVVACYRNRRI
jgi:uncharacterized membrane protein